MNTNNNHKTIRKMSVEIGAWWNNKEDFNKAYTHKKDQAKTAYQHAKEKWNEKFHHDKRQTTAPMKPMPEMETMPEMEPMPSAVETMGGMEQAEPSSSMGARRSGSHHSYKSMMNAPMNASDGGDMY